MVEKIGAAEQKITNITNKLHFNEDFSNKYEFTQDTHRKFQELLNIRQETAKV